MKRSLMKHVMLYSLVGTLALTASARAEEASQFTMATTDEESTGDFTITLRGENIKDLFAYEAKFTFDPGKLEIVEAAANIEGFSVSPIVKNNEVTIAHTKVGRVDGESGNLNIATITFKAKKAGSTQLKWTSMKIVDHNLNSQSFALSQLLNFTRIFSDLSGHWAKTDIMQMVDKQIVEGMDDDHFTPDMNVTRAQFATLIAKGLKLNNGAGSQPFEDVAPDSWYAGTVKQAYAAGLINGISDREFAPERQITREEIAAMLIRAVTYAAGKDISGRSPGTSVPFRDEAAVSDWAKKDVELAAAAGLMNGRSEGQFAPQASATRAEAVVVLKRLLEK